MAQSTHRLPVRPLSAEMFAPYGQVIPVRYAGGQGVGSEEKDPAADPAEAQLVLTNGTPRLWVMHLPHVGLSFTRIARHRRVTQCLGALGGKEWLIAVAPPDSADDARPRLEDIVAFRVPGDRIVKLHVATWHAGPHFVHDECLFLNLENMDTNDGDFHAAQLGVTCAYAL
jgi:ureidoglycolate lyase